MSRMALLIRSCSAVVRWLKNAASFFASSGLTATGLFFTPPSRACHDARALVVGRLAVVRAGSRGPARGRITRAAPARPGPRGLRGARFAPRPARGGNQRPDQAGRDATG